MYDFGYDDPKSRKLRALRERPQVEMRFKLGAEAVASRNRFGLNELSEAITNATLTLGSSVPDPVMNAVEAFRDAGAERAFRTNTSSPDALSPRGMVEKVDTLRRETKGSKLRAKWKSNGIAVTG